MSQILSQQPHPQIVRNRQRPPPRPQRKDNMGWSGWEEFRNLTPDDKTNLQEQKWNQDDGEASLALRATRNRNAGRGRAERQPGIARRRGIGPERRQRASTPPGHQAGPRRASGSLRGGAPNRWRCAPAAATIQPAPVSGVGQETDGAGPAGLQLLRGGPLWLPFASEAQGIRHYQLRDTAPGLGRVWQEGQNRQAGRQTDGAEPGPVCRRQSGGVLRRARAYGSRRASPESLTPAGELAEGEATSGSPGPQPRALLRRASGGCLVDRKSLEGVSCAAHCVGVAGTAPPAHPSTGARTQDLDPGADRRRPGATTHGFG